MVARGRGARADRRVYDTTRRAGDIAHEHEVSAHAADCREYPAALARFAMNRAVGEVGDQQTPVRSYSETGVFLACGQRNSRDDSSATVNLTNRPVANVRDVDCAIGRHGDIGSTLQSHGFGETAAGPASRAAGDYGDITRRH